MQPGHTHTADSAGAAGPETQVCPGCRATMLRGMRFCRFCGYRLGEGVEEYAETVRLPNPPDAGSRPTARAPHAHTAGVPPAWGAMQPVAATAALEGACGATTGLARKRRWMRWPMWVAIGVAVTVMVNVDGLRNGDPGRGPAAAVNHAPRSYFGVNDFADFRGETFEGAIIDNVEPPGSPADRAKLVGGDIIVSVDDETVASAEDLRRVLRSTPVGKTVTVEFVRDGQRRSTTLTTTSGDEIERLQKAFARRREGKGFFGINDTDDLERVLAPGLNVYGLRLKGVRKNQNAYVSGLRDGDILVEFDGVPIRTTREFAARIKRAVPDSTITVVVVRGDERLEIPLKVGTLQ